MNLSKHFTLREAEKSQYAERHGIDNTAPDWMHRKLAFVCEGVLEPVREHFERPFSPSSFYRCSALNIALGGSPESQHPKGEAVDFEVPGISNIVTARWMAAELDTFDQLILECFKGPPDSGWIHCSLTEHGQNRRQILTFDGVKYSHGLPPVTTE